MAMPLPLPAGRTVAVDIGRHERRLKRAVSPGGDKVADFIVVDVVGIAHFLDCHRSAAQTYEMQVTLSRNLVRGLMLAEIMLSQYVAVAKQFDSLIDRCEADLLFAPQIFIKLLDIEVDPLVHTLVKHFVTDRCVPHPVCCKIGLELTPQPLPQCGLVHRLKGYGFYANIALAAELSK